MLNTRLTATCQYGRLFSILHFTSIIYLLSRPTLFRGIPSPPIPIVHPVPVWTPMKTGWSLFPEQGSVPLLPSSHASAPDFVSVYPALSPQWSDEIPDRRSTRTSSYRLPTVHAGCRSAKTPLSTVRNHADNARSVLPTAVFVFKIILNNKITAKRKHKNNKWYF